jgi:hypothetical protein
MRGPSQDSENIGDTALKTQGEQQNDHAQCQAVVGGESGHGIVEDL